MEQNRNPKTAMPALNNSFILLTSSGKAREARLQVFFYVGFLKYALTTISTNFAIPNDMSDNGDATSYLFKISDQKA